MSDELFPQSSTTMGWDDDKIGRDLPVYDGPKEPGKKERIYIISPIEKRVIHYKQGLGYFVCNGGLCCKLMDEPATHRLGCVIFKYETDASGNLPTDGDGKVVVRGEVKVLIMTAKMYRRFADANKTAEQETDGAQTLKTVDVILHCDNKSDVEYKRWTINLARRAAYWLEWAAKVKKDGSDEDKARLTDQKLEMSENFKKIPAKLGNEKSDEEIAAAFGQSHGDTPPPVGDPTDALKDL